MPAMDQTPYPRALPVHSEIGLGVKPVCIIAQAQQNPGSRSASPSVGIAGRYGYPGHRRHMLLRFLRIMGQFRPVRAEATLSGAPTPEERTGPLTWGDVVLRLLVGSTNDSR